MNRFVQIHTLTSYPASLLNRDDAGFAKRIPFGGVTRTRVSSQCLKRHWRTFEGEGALSGLGQPMSVRSRYTFDELVVQPLVGEGVPAELAREVTRALMSEVLGKSAKAAKADARADEKEEEEDKDAKTESTLQTGQITVLGRPEVAYLLELARKVCRKKPDPAKIAKAVSDHLGADGRKNLRELRLGAGLDAAMFGRMVTSDILARGDAALHVAHAFTVHGEATETDYFSAVDDLPMARAEDGQGSGHIGNAELTSGLFYGYVVIDVPLLVSNLEGVDRKAWEKADRKLAAQLAERMVKLVATVSPGAKLGSTAPHAYAHLVLAESGNAQPRTLANAFLEPVITGPRQPDPVAAAYRALARHSADLDRMYGPAFQRRLAAIGPADGLADVLRAPANASLAEVATWVADQVRGG